MTKYRIESGEFDIPDGQDVGLGTFVVRRLPELFEYSVYAGGPIHDAVAVCTHPTFMEGRVWQFTDEWMSHLATIGVKRIRGMMSHTSSGSKRCIELARQYGMKITATVLPEDYSLTDAQFRTRLRWIGENLDVIDTIELMNEPSTRRSKNDPPIPDNWPAIMLRHANIVREILGSRVWLLAPAIQQANADRAQRDTIALFSTGIGQVVDGAALHDYDGDDPPGSRTDQRIQVIHDAADRPLLIDITEYGYTHAVNNPRSERDPIGTGVAAAYLWPGVFKRVMNPRVRFTYLFEALCDPQPLSITEAHFGLIETHAMDPANWESLQAAREMQYGISLLADSSAMRETRRSPVRLRVDVMSEGSTYDLRWYITQSADRNPFMWIWRERDLWDGDSREYIQPDPPLLSVKITTSNYDEILVELGGEPETVELPLSG